MNNEAAFSKNEKNNTHYKLLWDGQAPMAERYILLGPNRRYSGISWEDVFKQVEQNCRTKQ